VKPAGGGWINCDSKNGDKCSLTVEQEEPSWGATAVPIGVKRRIYPGDFLKFIDIESIFTGNRANASALSHD
jgi:hypothetical protein